MPRLSETRIRPWIFIGFFLYILILFELFLRAQQAIGPFIDLNPSVTFDELSDVVNHQHAEGLGYDRYGIRHLPSENPDSGSTSQKVLFMGDSFMEGYGASQSIPAYVLQYFKWTPGSKIEFLNAGCSSYSPLIFMPQFERIYPVYRPAKVILLIDETDFGDDFIRYRHLARWKGDRVIGVAHTPINRKHMQGLSDLRLMPLYLERLIYKYWYFHIRMPQYIEEYRKRTGLRETVLEFAFISRDPESYRQESDFFESNVDRLIKLIIAKVGHNNLVLVRHPHLRQLTGQMRTNVRPILERMAQKHSVLFYDFTEDFKRASGGNYARYYWPNDMHFNYDGLKIYGSSLAAFLDKKGFFDDLIYLPKTSLTGNAS